MQEIITTTRKPDVTFYRNGRIDISAGVARSLRLRAGDVISIAYESADTPPDRREWYLHVRPRESLLGRHEGAVFAAKKGYGSFRTHSRCMARTIFELCRATGQARVRLAVGQPVINARRETLLPIIYKNILP